MTFQKELALTSAGLQNSLWEEGKTKYIKI